MKGQRIRIKNLERCLSRHFSSQLCKDSTKSVGSSLPGDLKLLPTTYRCVRAGAAGTAQVPFATHAALARSIALACNIKQTTHIQQTEHATKIGHVCLSMLVAMLWEVGRSPSCRASWSARLASTQTQDLELGG